jgi:hypothetical protein
MTEELKLGLSGRRVIFPDGRPFCLVCGATPRGLRRVSFKDPEFAERATEGVNLLLQHVHPALAWANKTRLVRFDFEAPLCFRHLWKGRLGEILVIGLFLVCLALFVVLWLKGRLPNQANLTGSYLKTILVSIPVLGAWLLWKRSVRKPLLPCQAKRLSKEMIVLSYPESAPRAR